MSMDEGNTFVGKDFYIQPPDKNASPEEWHEWLRKDSLKRRGAKAAFTRKQKAQACDDPRLNRVGLVKLGGVWRQSGMLFSGSAEDGTLEREVAIDAHQEVEVMVARQLKNQTHARGGTRKNRNKNRRARRKARRKTQYQ